MSSRLEHIKDWDALAKPAKYRVHILAITLEVSPRQLERFFLDKRGMCPRKWLRELKMWRAVEMICDRRTVKEVATELDYESAAHFTRDFKDYHGVTPSQYRSNISEPPLALKMSRLVKQCRV